MKMFTILFAIVFSNVDLVTAQPNLVPNPSFENYFNLNGNGNLIENFVYNWYGGRGYFHVNRTNTYYALPANGLGFQNAFSGNAYCGIYTYLINSYPIRHYIQTKLIDTLQHNKKYRVAFNVSLSDTMHAFNNSIGAYFATDSLNSFNNFVIDANPQIINNIENDLNNKTSWTLICDTFVANGGESWITIGNFLDDSLSIITPLDSVCDQPFPFNCGSYYYIDDVSVTIVDETGIQENRQFNFRLFPNPNTGNFRLQYNGIFNKKTMLYITDVFGKIIDSKEITKTTTDYENTSLQHGLYFYSLRKGDEELQIGKFLIIK